MARGTFHPQWELEPQRHHPIYRLTSTRRQGRVVTAWWRFQYVQYSFLTLFGFLMWWKDRTPTRGFSAGYLKKSSENYVMACMAACLTVSIAGFTTKNSAVMWSAVILGGYRAYEVFFAQLYYIMQTKKTRVTSFTRTFLFHVIFVLETMFYMSTILVQREGSTVAHALGESFKSVTLQGDFLTVSAASDNVVQVAALGCNLIGIVILLASLPVLLGSVSKTWEQAS